MRTRSLVLGILGSLMALGVLFLSGTQLAAEEPAPTIPITIPATLPVMESELHLPLIYNDGGLGSPIVTPEPTATILPTVPVPTIPAGTPRLWLPHIRHMATPTPLS